MFKGIVLPGISVRSPFFLRKSLYFILGVIISLKSSSYSVTGFVIYSKFLWSGSCDISEKFSFKILDNGNTSPSFVPPKSSISSPFFKSLAVITHRPPHSFFACRALQCAYSLPSVTLYRFCRINRQNLSLLNTYW